LDIEAVSHRRLTDKHLAQLVGGLGQFVDIQVKDMDEALRESSPAELVEPYVLPLEVVAELEEKMLCQWIDESVPALDGLTPRDAVKTSEGRQQVLDLIEYSAQLQKRMP
jgi:hypothetical protein